MQTIPNIRFLFVIMAGITLYLGSLIKVDALIMILNGFYIGSMAAMIVAFWELVYRTVLGERPYDRVSQMTFGFVAIWVAYSGAVFISIYYRSAGLPPVNVTYMTAVFRAIAILAAVAQVTAPDFGLGIFHGRDRKTLWLSLSVGLIVALIVIYAQNETVLESFVKSTEVLGVDLAYLAT